MKKSLQFGVIYERGKNIYMLYLQVIESTKISL